MSPRQCLAFGPGCSDGGMALPGQSRCAQHALRAWMSVKTPGMAARAGFYRTRAWRERSKRQLAAEPLCRSCGRPASVADHVVALGLGGSPDGELQSLCKPCHTKKSASEGGKAAKQKRQKGIG
jgi:5-methylcytosine-specific restriction protein A